MICILVNDDDLCGKIRLKVLIAPPPPCLISPTTPQRASWTIQVLLQPVDPVQMFTIQTGLMATLAVQRMNSSNPRVCLSTTFDMPPLLTSLCSRSHFYAPSKPLCPFFAFGRL